MKLVQWRESMTECIYEPNSLAIEVSLGEGALGIIILESTGKFYIESVPSYGGNPRFERECESVQQALEIFKTWT